MHVSPAFEVCLVVEICGRRPQIAPSSSGFATPNLAPAWSRTYSVCSSGLQTIKGNSKIFGSVSNTMEYFWYIHAQFIAQRLSAAHYASSLAERPAWIPRFVSNVLQSCLRLRLLTHSRSSGPCAECMVSRRMWSVALVADLPRLAHSCPHQTPLREIQQCHQCCPPP